MTAHEAKGIAPRLTRTKPAAVGRLPQPSSDSRGVWPTTALWWQVCALALVLPRFQRSTGLAKKLIQVGQPNTVVVQ